MISKINKIENSEGVATDTNTLPVAVVHSL
jgi:hypothetical protein